MDLQDILDVYSHYVDKGDIDKANFFLALFTGFVGFIKYLKTKDRYLGEYLSNLIRSLRIQLIEGPNYLNPYVMELLGILEEELSQELFNEFLTKLRALLREERLDRLEV